MLAATNKVRQLFRDLVSTPRALRTVYDNDPTTLPTSGEWCRLTVTLGESIATCLGGERYRTTGLAIAQLFAPLRTGDANLLAHGDAIQLAFRGRRENSPSLTFLSPHMAGKDREEAMLQVTINIPFRVDET